MAYGTSYHHLKTSGYQEVNTCQLPWKITGKKILEFWLLKATNPVLLAQFYYPGSGTRVAPFFAILQMLFSGYLNQAQTISDRKDQAHRLCIYEEPPPEFKEKEEW